MVLVPEVPEQPLLGNALGDPAQDPGLGARHPAGIRRRTGFTAPVALRLGQDPAERVPESLHDAGALVRLGRHRLVGVSDLAVELIASCSDRNQIDVHRLVYDSTRALVLRGLC